VEFEWKCAGASLTEILIVLLAFSVRAFGVRKSPVPSDTYGHLYLMKEVLAQRAGPFGSIVTKAVGSSGHRDAYLWHWLVGRFPFRLVVRLQRWINPLLDSVFIAIAYSLTVRSGIDQSTSMVAVLLYLFTPAWFSSLSTGTRISSLTPRLSGEVATNLFFIITLLPVGFPLSSVLAIGACLSAYVVLASKFGIQAMFFLVPVISLTAWTPWPIVALALGLAVALLASRGQFLRSLGAQIRFLVWYFRKNLRGQMALSHRNSIREMLRSSPSDDWRMYVARVAYRMVSTYSLSSVLIKMPVVLVALVVAFQWYLAPDPPALYVKLVAPVIAGFVLLILINLRPLLFLGEAERYLNHVAWFIAASAALFLAPGSVMLWVILGHGVLFWLGESLLLHRVRSRMLPDEEKADGEVIEFLKSLQAVQVVLCYPHNAVGHWRIMLETAHRVIMQYTTAPAFAKEFEEKYAADYPYVRLERFSEMADEYGVGILVLHNKSLHERGLNQWAPPEEWVRVHVGGPRYSVYRREVADRSSTLFGRGASNLEQSVGQLRFESSSC
jgi:hypothetical protein